MSFFVHLHNQFVKLALHFFDLALSPWLPALNRGTPIRWHGYGMTPSAPGVSKPYRPRSCVIYLKMIFDQKLYIVVILNLFGRFLWRSSILKFEIDFVTIPRKAD